MEVNAVVDNQPDRGAAPPAPAGTPAPAPQTPESTKPEAATQDSLPFLLTKGGKQDQPKETIDLEHVDISKLPPEMQAWAKGFQADYTRKTQRLADDRRLYENRLEQITSLITERLTPRTPEQPTNEPTVLDKIKALREDGREDEALELILQAAREQATKEMEPVKRQAEVEALQTSFRNIVSDMRVNDPLISRYHDEVAKTFDDPSFAPYRSDIISNNDTMKKWLPLLLRGIALEKHARFLETNYNKAVEDGIKKGMEETMNKARNVPSKLISSGASTLNTPRAAARSVREAVELSMLQLTGQTQ